MKMETRELIPITRGVKLKKVDKKKEILDNFSDGVARDKYQMGYQLGSRTKWEAEQSVTGALNALIREGKACIVDRYKYIVGAENVQNNKLS